jgi:putative acetyltransferase
VIAGWRGLGVGRALMATPLTACPARGFSRIELEVYAHNTRAIDLYTSMGFVEEGRKRGARILDGNPQDLVLMARL